MRAEYTSNDRGSPKTADKRFRRNNRGDSIDDLKSDITKTEKEKSLSRENRIRVIKSKVTKVEELLSCLKHSKIVVDCHY